MPKSQDKSAQNTVLFLCTGNYYRSRFAELYFNAQASARGLDWRAESRGLNLQAIHPGPISRETLAWLKYLGVTPSATHRYPMPASEWDLQVAHLVVAVKEDEHRPLLQRHFPHWADRVEYWDIHDLDFADPDEALPELAAHVEELLNRLATP